MDRYTYKVWYVGGIFPWRWQVLCNGETLRRREAWSGKLIDDYIGFALNKSMAEDLGNWFGGRLYKKHQKERQRSVSYIEAEQRPIYL
jgi:hypothetical protein